MPDSEGYEVAWCTTPTHGSRVIPPGTLTGVQVLNILNYIQVVAHMNQINVNLPGNDTGGELDPHGQDLVCSLQCALVLPTNCMPKRQEICKASTSCFHTPTPPTSYSQHHLHIQPWLLLPKLEDPPIDTWYRDSLTLVDDIDFILSYTVPYSMWHWAMALCQSIISVPSRCHPIWASSIWHSGGPCDASFPTLRIWWVIFLQAWHWGQLTFWFDRCLGAGVMFQLDFTYYADTSDCPLFPSLSSLHRSPCMIQIWSQSLVRYDLMTHNLYDTILQLSPCTISISEPRILQYLVLGELWSPSTLSTVPQTLLGSA